MENSKSINSLPINENPKLNGFTIYDNLKNTYITRIQNIYVLFIVSNMLNTDSRLDNIKFDKNGNTVPAVGKPQLNNEKYN